MTLLQEGVSVLSTVSTGNGSSVLGSGLSLSSV